MKVVAKMKNRRVIVQKIGEDRNLIVLKRLTTESGKPCDYLHVKGKVMVTRVAITDASLFALHACIGEMLKNLNNVENV